MIEGVFRFSALYAPNYAVSNAGTLVYIPETTGTAVTGRNLAWVDMKGKEEIIAAAPPNAYSYARISPDGNRIAMSIATASNANIWIWDLLREVPTRLTFDTSLDVTPLWTRDGKRIFLPQRSPEGMESTGRLLMAQGESSNLSEYQQWATAFPLPGRATGTI